MNKKMLAFGMVLALFAGIAYADELVFGELSGDKVNDKIEETTPELDSPVSSCMTIAVPGDYTLTGPVASPGATCFTVAASNVKLDCAGNSITGTTTANTFGVVALNQTNVTVQNCVINGYKAVIKFIGVSGSAIKNLVATNAYPPGTEEGAVYLHGSSGNTLDNLNVTANLTAAIFIGYGSHNNVLTNSVGVSKGTGYGIQVHLSNGNIVTDSKGTSQSSDGVYLVQANSNYLNNVNGASLTGRRGIYLYKSSSNGVSNAVGTSGTNHGVMLSDDSNYNNITNVTGTTGGNGNGVHLRIRSNYNRLVNVVGTSVSGYGIMIWDNAMGTPFGSNYNLVKNSMGTSSSGSGIRVERSNYNVIDQSGGTSTSGNGIKLAYANSNTIQNSIGTSLGSGINGNGINVFSSNDTNVSNNAVFAPNGYGTYYTESFRGNVLSAPTLISCSVGTAAG